MIYIPKFQLREKSVKVGVSLALGLGFLYLFLPFFGPILLSIVFAFALEPTIAAFSHKKVSRLRYTCISLILIAVIVATLPLAVLSIVSYSELTHMSGAGLEQSRAYQTFQQFRGLSISSLESLSTQFKLQSMFRAATLVDQGVNHLSTYFTNAIPGFVASLPSFALSFLVFNTMLFLFLFRARTIKGMYLRTHFLKHRELNYLIYSLQTSCRASLVATVITGLMHATLLSAASWFFNTGTPVIVFPLTFLCSFLPVLGTFPVTLSLTGLALLHHEPSAALGFLCIAGLSAMLDYWMRMRWMVNESRRIHPALNFIGLLGAIMHFGLAGVIYGPLCISLAAMIIPKFIAPKKTSRTRTSQTHALKPPVLTAKPAVLAAEAYRDASILNGDLSPQGTSPELEKRPWVN